MLIIEKIIVFVIKLPFEVLEFEKKINTFIGLFSCLLTITYAGNTSFENQIYDLKYTINICL